MFDLSQYQLPTNFRSSVGAMGQQVTSLSSYVDMGRSYNMIDPRKLVQRKAQEQNYIRQLQSTGIMEPSAPRAQKKQAIANLKQIKQHQADVDKESQKKSLLDMFGNALEGGKVGKETKSFWQEQLKLLKEISDKLSGPTEENKRESEAKNEAKRGIGRGIATAAGGIGEGVASAATGAGTGLGNFASKLGAAGGLVAMGAGIGGFIAAMAGAMDLAGALGSDGANAKSILTNLGEGLAAFEGPHLAGLAAMAAAGGLFGAAAGPVSAGVKGIGAGIMMTSIGAGIGGFVAAMAAGMDLAGALGSDGSGAAVILTNIGEGLAAFEGPHLQNLAAMASAGGIFGAVTGPAGAAWAGVGAGIMMTSIGAGIGGFVAAMAAGMDLAGALGVDGSGARTILTNIGQGLAAFAVFNAKELMTIVKALSMLGPAIIGIFGAEAMDKLKETGTWIKSLFGGGEGGKEENMFDRLVKTLEPLKAIKREDFAGFIAVAEALHKLKPSEVEKTRKVKNSIKRSDRIRLMGEDIDDEDRTEIMKIRRAQRRAQGLPVGEYMDDEDRTEIMKIRRAQRRAQRRPVGDDIEDASRQRSRHLNKQSSGSSTTVIAPQSNTNVQTTQNYNIKPEARNSEPSARRYAALYFCPDF